ncbi:hypothetical protein ACJX0J_040560, partial [Zea mays]
HIYVHDREEFFGACASSPEVQERLLNKLVKLQHFAPPFIFNAATLPYITTYLHTMAATHPDLSGTRRLPSGCKMMTRLSAQINIPENNEITSQDGHIIYVKMH